MSCCMVTPVKGKCRWAIADVVNGKLGYRHCGKPPYGMFCTYHQDMNRHFLPDWAISPRGYLYCVQLVPELDGRRVKIGRSYSHPVTRVKDFKTTCPNARLAWVVEHGYWAETNVHKWCQSGGGGLTTPIGKEVYQCRDLVALHKNVSEYVTKCLIGG